MRPRPVYRAGPGHAVEFGVGAKEPGEDSILYETLGMPAGASIEGEPAIVRWTLPAEQLGPFYL